MVVMLLLPSLAAMADVAASCPVEVVAVVVGDVEGFDKELVEEIGRASCRERVFRAV